MALHFGKRDEPTNTLNQGLNTPRYGATANSSATPTSTAETRAPSVPTSSNVPEGGSKLTVGPNIKLKGVEITDCDTLVVEGTVEAAMNSRVIQIAEQGAFKGSAEIDIAEVRGIFDGNLTVRQKLVIFATGKVIGKIRYGKIVIEEGGQLSGEITFGISQDSSPAAGSGAVTNGSGKPSVKGEQLAVAA